MDVLLSVPSIYGTLCFVVSILHVSINLDQGFDF